jgi:hypothetical protein
MVSVSSVFVHGPAIAFGGQRAKENDSHREEGWRGRAKGPKRMIAVEDVVAVEIESEEMEQAPAIPDTRPPVSFCRGGGAA